MRLTYFAPGAVVFVVCTVAILLLTGCATKPPPRSTATVTLSSSLQRQARANDEAQAASRAIGGHITNAREALTRADFKDMLVEKWYQLNRVK